jgi:hypothetical protein
MAFEGGSVTVVHCLALTCESAVSGGFVHLSSSGSSSFDESSVLSAETFAPSSGRGTIADQGAGVTDLRCLNFSACFAATMGSAAAFLGQSGAWSASQLTLFNLTGVNGIANLCRMKPNMSLSLFDVNWLNSVLYGKAYGMRLESCIFRGQSNPITLEPDNEVFERFAIIDSVFSGELPSTVWASMTANIANTVAEADEVCPTHWMASLPTVTFPSFPFHQTKPFKCSPSFLPSNSIPEFSRAFAPSELQIPSPQVRESSVFSPSQSSEFSPVVRLSQILPPSIETQHATFPFGGTANEKLEPSVVLKRTQPLAHSLSTASHSFLKTTKIGHSASLANSQRFITLPSGRVPKSSPVIGSNTRKLPIWMWAISGAAISVPLVTGIVLCLISRFCPLREAHRPSITSEP